MNRTQNIPLASAILVSILLAACSPVAAPPPAIQDQVPPQTIAAAVPSPTHGVPSEPPPSLTPTGGPSVQPTATFPPTTIAPAMPSPTQSVPSAPSPSPTPTGGHSVEPTATFSPEVIATKPEDIAGVWLLKKFIGQGGLVKFPADLTFRQDGTFSFDEIDDPMHIFGGTLAFAEGQVTLDSEECYDEIKAIFYHCTMTFTIFSTFQSGKPVRIRLQSAVRRGVFNINVDGKTLMLDEP